MNWSSDWDQAVKQTGQAILDLVPQLYDSQIKFIHENVEYKGILVGDLVVYSDWGWKVIHYPTLAKFDDPDKGAVPAGNYSKEALLSWCDTVQTKHGQLWVILRELTPDTYDDKSDRVMKAKDRIRDWCLSVEVK